MTTEESPGRVSQFVRRLLEFGLDRRGPVESAAEFGRRVRKHSRSDEQAIRKIKRQSQLGGGIGGFATGLGGFVTMPVAVPVNVLEFYIQAVRMVGAIATVRGHDISDPPVRTAVLLTLVGSKADDVLAQVGVVSTTGPLANVALRRLPPEALMVVNKAIGMRLLKSLGERTLTKLGRAVPFAGGAIGGGVDVWMMSRIAEQAKRSFPQTEAAAVDA
ncbi:hypothetical protein GCM10011575_46060 [Microlunatus endophyticus]|uniref:EcsC protein family protein n=1 Tax=Microlunatus endophyticus TaxID=1716077 RepID=A0A917SJ19_9ACTN|nr:EcsC family protein [Microlunatus endophyticus]GGL82571.1 hypothetical protein GCM10011575_46060 [Microlunatus endophyticus]